MAKHKKSMLEAFNTAGGLTPPKPQERSVPSPPAAEEQRQPATPVAPASATPARAPQPPAAPAPQAAPISGPEVSAGGPFVEPPQAGARAVLPVPSAASVASAGRSEPNRLQSPSSALVWVLLGMIVIAFSSAAWYGKREPGPDGVQAASGGVESMQAGARKGTGAENAALGGFAPSANSDRPKDGLPGSPEAQSAGALPGADGFAIKDALSDPKQQFTVVVVTYGKGQSDLAAASWDHLLDAGLPVNRILRVGSKLVVCAGAASTRDQLLDLEDRIQELSLNGKKRVFGDAFIDSIDKYIDR